MNIFRRTGLGNFFQAFFILGKFGRIGGEKREGKNSWK